MTKLCVEIGARLTGSVENKAATDYAFEVNLSVERVSMWIQLLKNL